MDMEEEISKLEKLLQQTELLETRLSMLRDFAYKSYEEGRREAYEMFQCEIKYRGWH